ncbi:oxalate decarboxylase [Trametes versicolor FP-101664 SS1]|uniref:oxalate decarboxylase n=1 Tax=Trametes versicolor (strain FP-101664) TaxID=717944 RepID=UPI0004623897|nr:oxalate decarboxylase [Trametes versicolor FP-101664 SS1]EIW57501.1 oxalate decarboxylase [Trametes versicolor FP-101664 SS1]
MAHTFLPLAYALLLSATALAAPAVSVSSDASTATAAAAAPAETVPLASDNANGILWLPDTNIIPQAMRGPLGANILGPQNIPIDRQNADLLAPPTTDAGNVQNAKWPFSLSHNRLQTGGWARQQNQDVMPIATSMAGVNMRLEAGAVRELHWHKTAEWAYMISGSAQITAVDADGKNFIGNVRQGDLWYFPPGIPHSIQALNDSAAGTEFLLVFDDGAFSEDSTFLLTDWLAHVPKEVIAKNFQTSISAFDHIPAQQLYIFPSTPPPDNNQVPKSPQGTIPNPFTFSLSQVKATELSGGTVKIVDSSTFTAATAISASEITVEPGAMRELHWHPTQDEWTFFISGQGRVTLFASSGNSRTFDYEAGDVGFVPASFGHFVENTGNTTLHFLEIFNSGRVQDISLSQWLALTPPDLVKAHLQISDETISHLSKTKPIVVGPQ